MPPDAKSLKRFSKTVAHPLRIRILRHLGAVDQDSPTRMATEFGEPLGNIAYHVNELRHLDALALSREVPRRGAAEHFYAPTPYGGTVLNIIRFVEDPWPDTRPDATEER